MDKITGSNIRSSESVRFKQKRSEGGDGSHRPNKKLEVSKLDPVNSVSYVQILGNGMDTQDTLPSVLLFFDKQRFIFNVGEGFQRFCIEHKIKLSKIDHIFLSRVCSETAGGLSGVLLTLSGVGDVGKVKVWGPTNLDYLIAAMNYFIRDDAMDRFSSFGLRHDSNGDAISTSRELDDPHVLIDDGVVKISAIVLQPSRLDTALNETKSTTLSVIYICELQGIKRKFNPKKAASLGLKPGPKYDLLQRGQRVMSDCNDTMVDPREVLDPSVPAPIVLIMDCPTPLHLQELLSVQSLTHYYADTAGNVPEISKSVNCIIHLSPAHITSTSDYQILMSKFGAAQHIMAGNEMKNIEVPILKASARMGARLNYLCPQLFPAPGLWSLKCMPSGLKASNEDLTSGINETIPAENLLKFHLRPYKNLGLDKSGVPKLTSSSAIIDELLSEIPKILDESQKLNQLWSGNGETSGEKTFVQANGVMTEEPSLHDSALPGCLEDVSRDDVEIVFLGTGSSQPSQYRNVSSIFINLFSKGSLLLDCGEGTLGQLKRRFGIEGADEAVRCLRCIWISHIHADHHTGLARILALRTNLLKGIPHDPLIVIGPVQLEGYLDAYQRLEDLDMQFLDCKYTKEASLKAFNSNEDGYTISLEGQRGDSTMSDGGSRMQSFSKRQRSPFQNADAAAAVPILKSLKKVLVEAGLETLVSVPVEHCEPAFGVILKAANRINRVGKTIPGWKLVYSGDMRPCTELKQASCGATVLIHEATFEDSLSKEAEAKKHSTVKEAVEAGNSSGVYRLILTHFSQRYPKIPKFDGKNHMHKMCVAFDNMSVNLADLPVLPRVLQSLELLFDDEKITEDVAA